MVPPVAPPASVLPVVRNVKIINGSGDAESVGVIHGLAGSPVQNVSFKDCRIDAKKGFWPEYERGVGLSGLILHVEDGPPIA
jgi:hypothetical protein